MFSFIAIFIFSLVWIFILMQLIDRIFVFKERIKIGYSYFNIVIPSLFFTYLLSISSFYLVLNIFWIIPNFLGLETQHQDFEARISQSDCLLLTNAIKQTEISMGREANHRYLEETAHLFTIKLEYEKAAKKIENQAKIYNNLQLSTKGEKYAQKIGNKLKEQSELFTQRSTIKTNKQGIATVYKLLDKMDEILQERLRLIDQVKQQCNNTA